MKTRNSRQKTPFQIELKKALIDLGYSVMWNYDNLFVSNGQVRFQIIREDQNYSRVIWLSRRKILHTDRFKEFHVSIDFCCATPAQLLEKMAYQSMIEPSLQTVKEYFQRVA